MFASVVDNAVAIAGVMVATIVFIALVVASAIAFALVILVFVVIPLISLYDYWRETLAPRIRAFLRARLTVSSDELAASVRKRMEQVEMIPLPPSPPPPAPASPRRSARLKRQRGVGV